MAEKMELLLSDSRGVYIPRDFVRGFAAWNYKSWGLNGNSWEVRTVKKGPETDGYWDAWEAILNKAIYTDKAGVKYQLHHDGDLWAVAFDDPYTQWFLNENWGFDFEIEGAEA